MKAIQKLSKKYPTNTQKISKNYLNTNVLEESFKDCLSFNF